MSRGTIRKYIMVRKHRSKNTKLNVILPLRYAECWRYEIWEQELRGGFLFLLCSPSQEGGISYYLHIRQGIVFTKFWSWEFSASRTMGCDVGAVTNPNGSRALPRKNLAFGILYYGLPPVPPVEVLILVTTVTALASPWRRFWQSSPIAALLPPCNCWETLICLLCSPEPAPAAASWGDTRNILELEMIFSAVAVTRSAGRKKVIPRRWSGQTRHGHDTNPPG